MIIQPEKILENGLKAVGYTCYNSKQTSYYAVYDQFFNENNDEVHADSTFIGYDPRCPKERIIEVIAIGFTAYALDCAIDFSNKLQRVCFDIEEDDMYKEYSDSIQTEFKRDIPFAKEGERKSYLFKHFKKLLESEEETQKNNLYKEFFSIALDEYRDGYIRWLQNRISENEPPLTFINLIVEKEREYILGELRKQYEEIMSAESKGKESQKGDAEFGKIIHKYIKENKIFAKLKEGTDYYDTLQIRKLIGKEFPRYKEQQHWQAIQPYVAKGKK